GNYRRGFQVGKKWYSHLLDPRTGRPVESAVGVSVVAPCAATADVLATVFSVLSPAESLEMSKLWPGTGALLITENGERFSNDTWDSFLSRD
ncbi:FAD:protein FMN transferase, partial [bacterium]